MIPLSSSSGKAIDAYATGATDALGSVRDFPVVLLGDNSKGFDVFCDTHAAKGEKTRQLVMSCSIPWTIVVPLWPAIIRSFDSACLAGIDLICFLQFGAVQQHLSSRNHAHFPRNNVEGGIGRSADYPLTNGKVEEGDCQ
jgi:hypothetical protein